MKTDFPYYKVPFVSSVQEMVVNSAKTFKDKTALEDLNNYPVSSATFSQLLNYVIRFGKALNKLGLKERDHIAVIGDNRVQWGITYLTAMSWNMVIVPIDKNLSQNEILNILHESDSRAIVLSDIFENLMSEKKHVLKRLEFCISMDALQHNDEFYSMVQLINAEDADNYTFPVINPDEMAEIIFTSGSLGRAKGVMLSQKNLTANLMAMTQMIDIGPGDKFLSVLPIHHTYECTCGFLCPIFSGASAHYARSLKTVVDDLQRVRATILLGVPLLYEKMFKKIHKGIADDKVKSKIVPN